MWLLNFEPVRIYNTQSRDLNTSRIVASRLHMATQMWVNIGSDDSLLPGGTKPLLEPMLTYHETYSIAFTWEQFHKKFPWI